MIAAPSPAIMLVRPQLGQNIGKAARAMLNFGLTDMRIVAPRDGWPNPDAGPSASGADVVLERAQLFDTVQEPVPLRTRSEPPGLLAYRGKLPVGWISLGPREQFARLQRSPVMKAVDNRPVWSIICFVVRPEYRGQGVAHALLRGAIAYARKHGAKLLEAYPVDKSGLSNDDSMWFGAKSMYDSAGFEEVARRKPFRPIVRLNAV